MHASYWTPETKESFHQLAKNLHQQQFQAKIYPRLAAVNEDGGAHTLSPYHELKLANDLAYLACTEEGVKTISAVCLEEGPNSLTVRLASNELPCIKTVASLQSIVNGISSYAGRSKSTG